MPKQDYNWKRFWSLRTAKINFDEQGYLADPEWGQYYNPELVDLEAIADIPCLVLVGEPGIGKSKEMETLKFYTENKIDASSRILELNLRSCTSLKDDLFNDKIFTAWLCGTHHLYLFLDSFDEGLLSIPILSLSLIDELKKQKYRNHINRLHLRLACRTFVFPQILEVELQKLWQESNFRVYELAPLRCKDIIEAADIEGFSSDKFLKELAQKEVIPLAIRPVTLGLLLKIYHRHNGQYLSDQRIHELYLDGCRELCRESKDKDRHHLRPISNLDVDQRIVVAGRIAAITVFANRFAVGTGDQVDMAHEDVHLDQIYQGYEKANENEFSITREAVKEVLDTGLFSSRGLHRMGWAHQTYAEFLAAWYLVKHELPLAQVIKLISSTEDPEHKLIPQLHETAAWLAGMRADVLQEIIKTDPDVLLQSDVPTDANVRSQIVESLLTQYEQERLFNRNNHRNYIKLKHPNLTVQLQPYICNPNKQNDSRYLAIQIAEVCEVSGLQTDLVNLALDSSQLIDLRVSAARAIYSIGDRDAKLKLKPLAVIDLAEDENDELKGYALRSLWSDHLTAAELFNALSQPKKRNFTGMYKLFTEYEIAPKIQPDDLVFALEWLKKQGGRHLGDHFNKLGDAILIKAWENFYLKGVAEGFTKVAMVQWREHQKIFIDDDTLQQQFILSLLNDAEKRHALTTQTVTVISKIEKDPMLFIWSVIQNIPIREDIFWMIEMVLSSDEEKVQRVWSQLIQRSFDYQNVNQVDAIITATESNKILQEVFTPNFAAIELESDQAKELRANYIKGQEIEVLSQNNASQPLNPLPKDRIIMLLDMLETGDLSAWWRLNMEMTLQRNSKYYGDDFQLDLTKLIGWEEAEELTRKRIIEGAKNYVQHQNDISCDWIGTDKYNHAALAGCRAFHLLLKLSPDFFYALSPEIWKKWAPVVIATPNNSQEFHLELVKHTYLNAPEESINALITIIDKENQRHDYISGISYFDDIWDEQLKLALLQKVKDLSLKPRCFEQLAELLLKHGVIEARDFAESLISLPLPSTQCDRERILIASKIVFQNSDSSNWSFIWSLIQQDSAFGREVIELSVNMRSSSIQSDLTEIQLADLYLWLVRQYPYEEDPDLTNGVYDVTPRVNIMELRNSVLSQLTEKGTKQSCTEFEHLIQELPNLDWLKKILSDARANMRRKTWQPPQPEDILRLVMVQQPANSEILSKIDEANKGIKDMSEKPRVDLSGSKINGHININTGDGKAEQKIESKDPKGINCGVWIAIIIALLAIPISASVSGLFNPEVRQWLFNNRSTPEIPKKP
jgi:predicted NACHT family NTPase